MPSKILSFICHAPSVSPGAYSAVATASAASKASERKAENKSISSGHFTAIYENERFVRFKYISNAAL